MADVLVFDDDPALGDWAGEVLRRLGLSVDHYLSAAGAAQIVREARPRLIVLDIMMQGTDGLTVCRAVKNDPATRHVKVMVVSSKSFRHDQERALRYGADAFLPKPLVPEEFIRCAARLLGLESAAAPRPVLPEPAAVFFDRGLVLESSGLWLFCDPGEGAAAWVAGQAAVPQDCWLFLSRYPEDAGALGRTGAALLARGGRLRIAGPETPEGDLQMLAPALAPGSAGSEVPAPLLFPLKEGEFQLAPGLMAGVRYVRYPGATLAYRFELQGRRLVYCPWHLWDPGASSRRDHEWGKFLGFFKGADLLAHGAAPGCGPWEAVVDLACEAAVRRLVLLPVGEAGLAPQARARAASRPAALECPEPEPGRRLVL
ncbi:MAG: response regulator [Elusimicrobia bacterium]|nr:response regulator [Elusimicrobiota bacterium]